MKFKMKQIRYQRITSLKTNFSGESQNWIVPTPLIKKLIPTNIQPTSEQLENVLFKIIPRQGSHHSKPGDHDLVQKGYGTLLTLRDGFGFCRSITAWGLALSRAVGYKARPIYVKSEKFTHAWFEINTKKGWETIDTTPPNKRKMPGEIQTLGTGLIELIKYMLNTPASKNNYSLMFQNAQDQRKPIKEVAFTCRINLEEIIGQQRMEKIKGIIAEVCE
jgi:hypothetical protein